jgi:hypothetical protein
LSLTFGQFYQILDWCKSQFVFQGSGRVSQADSLEEVNRSRRFLVLISLWLGQIYFRVADNISTRS